MMMELLAPRVWGTFLTVRLVADVASTGFSRIRNMIVKSISILGSGVGNRQSVPSRGYSCE